MARQKSARRAIYLGLINQPNTLILFKREKLQEERLKRVILRLNFINNISKPICFRSITGV